MHAHIVPALRNKLIGSRLPQHDYIQGRAQDYGDLACMMHPSLGRQHRNWQPQQQPKQPRALVSAGVAGNHRVMRCTVGLPQLTQIGKKRECDTAHEQEPYLHCGPLLSSPGPAQQQSLGRRRGAAAQAPPRLLCLCLLPLYLPGTDPFWMHLGPAESSRMWLLFACQMKGHLKGGRSPQHSQLFWASALWLHQQWQEVLVIHM